MGEPLPAAFRNIKALTFDVFGTVVDWNGSVRHALIRHAESSFKDTSLAPSTTAALERMLAEGFDSLALAWRDTYLAFSREVAADPSKGTKTVEQHFLDVLGPLLERFGLGELWTPPQRRDIAAVWSQLDPWADSVRGLHMLNSRFRTATLSNGNVSLLESMTAHGGLPWTMVLSAAMFGSLKPNPRVYRGAAEKLGVRPDEVALVAAHLYDLKAAKEAGYGAVVYVERPREEAWDAALVERTKGEGWVDLWITEKEEGFVAVARNLGCAEG